MHFLTFSFIFFHFLSLSFIVFHCLSFFILFHFLFFFHFLSFSFIVFHCLSFFFRFRSLFFPFFFLSSCSFFSLVLEILFLLRLPHDFLLKLLCKKKHFFGPSREVLHWALSFFLLSIFSFSFSFSISFRAFTFFLCFSSFSFYSFIFLLFSYKKVSSFFIWVLKNLWRHSKIHWEKCTILSWLYLLCIGSSSLFHVE